MFLSEFNCCQKMLWLLKWWNSLRRALFCSCLMLLVIVRVQQQISLPTVQNLLWSVQESKFKNGKWGKCTKTNIDLKKNPIKVNNNAFCSWFIKWTRQWLCGLYEASYISCTSEAPQQFVRNRKTAERFWLQDYLAHFLFKTCSPKREINNV